MSNETQIEELARELAFVLKDAKWGDSFQAQARWVLEHYQPKQASGVRVGVASREHTVPIAHGGSASYTYDCEKAWRAHEGHFTSIMRRLTKLEQAANSPPDRAESPDREGPLSPARPAK